MLLTEWNTEDCIAVRTEEAWEDGREEGYREIARKMKEMGEPVEKIQIFTGLSAEAVEGL